MTTLQVTLSSSLTTSYFESSKQSLEIAPAPSTLLEELNSQESLSDSTLLKVVVLLADHPHTKLEQALKEKLAKTTPSQALEKVKSACVVSLLEDRLKILEVCKRILSLDLLKSGLKIDDPMAIAQIESPLIPKPARTIEKISDTAIQNWHKYSSIFGKIVRWIQTVMKGIFSAVGDSILSPVHLPPSNLITLQGYYKGYCSILNGVTFLTTSYLAFFGTTKMAALVGTGILTSVIAINYIHKRYRIGIPEQIDKKGLFKNTSLEAQNGEIKKMKGRYVEREQVQTAWNVAPTEKFRIALLVGPTGCGKTEFVKGLAWESIYEPDSFVFGKKIFTINTNDLAKEGTLYLNTLLADLAGLEDDIVLFFDEGQNAGGQAGQTGSLIETLKTTLLEKNIRAILATTDEEYKGSIAHNKPFVDRCSHVPFGQLPDAECKKILKDKVALDVDRMIDVDADAYDALLQVAAANPNRYNPRKVIDLHKDVRSFVYSWTPKQLSQQLDQLTNDKDDIEAQCKTDNNDPHWSTSLKGKNSLLQLEQKKGEVLECNKKIKTQKSALGEIARLRSLSPQYRKKYNEVVHQIIDKKNSAAKEELLKEFLYLKHVLRPALQDTLESKAREFTKDYKEELPLKIDAALIKKLYPDVYKDSSIGKSAATTSSTATSST